MPAILGLVLFASIFRILPPSPCIFSVVCGPAGLAITAPVCLSAEFPATFRAAIFACVDCCGIVTCENVYSWRDYPEMLDVAAGRVLAEMINSQPFRNGAMGVFPEDSMKKPLMSLEADISIALVKPARPYMTSG